MGQRFFAGLVNPFLGAGSWMMKDYLGGGIICGGLVLGYGLIIWGAVASIPTDPYYDDYYYDPITGEYVTNEPEPISENAMGLLITGVLVFVGVEIFAWIRPFSYHPAAKVAAFNPANFNIALLPNARGTEIDRVKLSYRFSY
jgi:hypothetical protein